MPGPAETPEIRPAPPSRRRRAGRFPLGASATIAELEDDPHDLLRQLREREPVSWLPALGGWLITRRDFALRVMRDSEMFTVDDPRFSTARVVGPSMLSLDGAEHGRHRDPFSQAFRVAAVRARLEAFVEAEAVRLVSALTAVTPAAAGTALAPVTAAQPAFAAQPAGSAELRRSLAGPLAVAVVAEVLGLEDTEPAVVLSWYDAIVGAVSALAGNGGGVDVNVTGTAAFGMLRASLEAAIARPGSPSLLAAAAAGDGGLTTSEVVSNAAVMMFGGIETTEGMISNAVLHLLSHPDQLRLVIADHDLVPDAVEESLRLEPAAAVIDRYATADVRIGDADISRGDLVTVSLAGANRDPAFFGDPDRFDVRRENARLSLAFAHGPHFCPGAHLARLEAQAAIRALLSQMTGLRLDPLRPGSARGLVFRKPPALHVLWDVRSG